MGGRWQAGRPTGTDQPGLEDQQADQPGLEDRVPRRLIPTSVLQEEAVNWGPQFLLSVILPHLGILGSRLSG